MPRPFRGAPKSSSFGIASARPSQCLPPVDTPVIKVTVMTGVSTGGRHWLGLALAMPNDDDLGAPRNGLGIRGHQIPHAQSQTRLPIAVPAVWTES